MKCGIDLKFIIEKIRQKVSQKGINVNSESLRDQLQYDEMRLRLYKHVFSTSEGRWVLLDIIGKCELLSPPDFSNSLALASTAGKRQVAVHVAQSLSLTFEDIVRFYSEIDIV